MSNKIEIRTRELRAESQGDEMAISGYAALFNSPSKDFGRFTESILPGAFDRALAEKQLVKFTFNHSMDYVLARTDNGTLALSTDPHGLKFRAVLNKNITQHRDLWEACRAGLYNECSFAFLPTPNGQQWNSDMTERTLTDLDLFDCALVGEPAYPGTSAAARAAGNQSELLARVAAMPGDWARSERAAALGKQIMAELLKGEQRGNEDFMASRATAALSEKDLDFCSLDSEFVYASPVDSDDEDNCFRFAYTINDAGEFILDEDSRQQVRHEISHSVRSARRERKSLRALKQKMELLRGF